jgi:HSP20 family molecular chaperone IbpA
MPSTLIATADPPFGHLARQMNKLVDQIHKGYYNFLPSETWAPNVNLYETDHAYVVCVDLAGVDKEKIELTVADGRLKLRGHRIAPTMPDEPGSPHPAQTAVGAVATTTSSPSTAASDIAHKKVRVHLMEIDHGMFAREVELPKDVDHERITANYRNGLLWVEIPKR